MNERLMKEAGEASIIPPKRNEHLCSDRVLFMCHRRGAAAGKPECSDFVLVQEQSVVADLAQRPGQERQPTPKCGDVVARRMPRLCICKAKPGGQIPRKRI